MTLYVVVNMENGTRLAVAAFSTASRAEHYIASKGLKEARVDFFEVGDDAPTNPRVVYVSQRLVREGVHELAGYYFSRYDAERATGPQGFERRLTIDPPEDAVTAEEVAGASADTVVERTEAAPEATPERTTAQPRRGSQVGARGGFPVAQLLMLVALVGAIAAVVVIFHRGPAVEHGQGLPGVDWLPPAASAVSFYREGRFLAAEFKISEEGFRALVTARGAELLGAPARGVMVPRYRLLASASNTPISPPAPGEPQGGFVELTDGYYWTRSDGGSVLTLAWDRRSGTGYLYEQ